MHRCIGNEILNLPLRLAPIVPILLSKDIFDDSFGCMEIGLPTGVGSTPLAQFIKMSNMKALICVNTSASNSLFLL